MPFVPGPEGEDRSASRERICRPPAIDRAMTSVRLAIRERRMLARLVYEFDMPVSMIIRLAIRSLYAATFGAEATRLPTSKAGEDAA